jgi:tetratricopeptide (TPR) repeat protein
MDFRECGDCNACCTGALVGNARGHQFGNGKPCIYLVEEKCSIYEDRPEACRNYQCAWSQHLFPEWMKPNLSGVLISVETENGSQYLKVVELRNNIEENVYNEINRFCRENGTYYRALQKNAPQIAQPPQENIPQLRGLEQFVMPLSAMGRKDLAKDVLDTYALHANNFYQYENLSKCYFDLKLYLESMHWGETAIDVSPDIRSRYTMMSNIISVCNNANYPEKALEYIDKCEKIAPLDVDMRMAKAFSLFLNNEKPRAESELRNILETEKDLNEETITRLKFNLGNYHLYRDEFLEGMSLFLNEGGKLEIWKPEAAFIKKDTSVADVVKKWDGTTIPGATIICNAEAGLGDEMVNFRFTELIEKRGMTPIWYNGISNTESSVTLTKVFTRHGVKVISNLNEITLTENTYYVQSMHIPVVMKLGYEDFWKGPYLTADPVYIEKWATQLAPGKKIGVRWQGNPEYEQNLHRSVPLNLVYDSVKHLDATFYSLQKDVGLSELTDFPKLVDLSSELNNWEDTLAVIANMDIVITSCTSIAHASAAMGKRTFVFVPISAYYVWSHSMEQSPWYGDNVTILRQDKPRSWTNPADKLKRLLP